MGMGQVESALAVQKLRPAIDAIKREYGEDRKSIQRETSALYEASGVSPTAGVPLPSFWRPLSGQGAVLMRALASSKNAGLFGGQRPLQPGYH